MTPGKNRLDQIVRGLDGVTPGRWVVRETTLHGIGYGGHWLEVSDEDQDICISGSGGARSYTQRVVDTQLHDDNEANLRHFSRCSPDAIREIAAYVRDLEERLAKAAEALEQIADHTARCEHDGGFDREIGPIGCNLGDKCLCIGLHPIARTALSQIRSQK